MGWTLSQPKPPTSSKPDENDRQVPRARVDSALAGLDWRKGARSDVSAQSGAAAQAGEGARARATCGGARGQAGGGAVRARARDGLSELAEAQGVCRAAWRWSSRFARTSTTTRGALRESRRVNGVSAADARRDLAERHGFSSWRELRRHVEAMRSGEEPPTPFVLAYRAVEDNDRTRLDKLVDRFPDLVLQRGTNGNDLLGMAGDLAIVALLLERGADPNRGNDYGWTKLHQAGYRTTASSPADARRRRAHGTVRPRRRRDAAGRGAVLGPPRGRGAARPGTRQPARCRRAGRPRADPRARRHAAGRRVPRLLSSSRRLPRLAALRRSPGGARRGARVGGEIRSGGGGARYWSS